MNIKLQMISFYTLVSHELQRMFRIYSQVFLPPMITTLLYFLIFGTIVGQRIGLVHGVNYTKFIAPGLIIMAVITNAYGNVSGSVFTARFQRSIEELQVSPLHSSLLLLGYLFGGIIRGFIVALLVFLVSAGFMGFHIHNIALTLLTILLVATLFSLAGFINGLLARNFDEISFVPTFILSPLTYLGGIFYSIEMLPPFWQNITHFNPVFYMVTLMRYAMIGHQETNVLLAVSIIGAMVISLTLLNLVLMKKGVGLRS